MKMVAPSLLPSFSEVKNESAANLWFFALLEIDGTSPTNLNFSTPSRERFASYIIQIQAFSGSLLSAFLSVEPPISDAWFGFGRTRGLESNLLPCS